MPARVTLVVPSAFTNLASDQPVTRLRCALVRHGQSESPVDAATDKLMRFANMPAIETVRRHPPSGT